MKKIFLFVLLSSLFSNSFGQITTSVNPSIAAMQALLQGNGVVVTGLTITCPAGAYATFNNGASALGGTLNSGILLTTGTASYVGGPNTSSNDVDYSAAGSALGDALSGGTTHDGCYINFLITPSCATLSINYVFASEEYPEYSVGTINDVFGFVLSGPNPAGGNFNQTNIATLPGTTTPVSIQNVNNGTSNTGPCVNCAYYIADPPGLVYDGKTTILTASATVIPCQTYTMTIGVWDDSDGILDSGVFLDVNGLSCANQPTIAAVANPSTTCGPQTVTLTASNGAASGTYTWTAPASGGLATTTGSVVTANPTAATTYTVLYTDINTCPGLPVTQTVAVAFTAPPALPVSQTPTGAICAGQSVTLTASGGAGTYSWTPGASLSSTTNSVTVATPTITTTYTVTKVVGACISFSVVTVNLTSTAVAITPTLSTICVGQTQSLTASGAGPFVWTASTGTNPASSATVTVAPSVTTTYTVLSGTGTCTSSAVATVSISTTPSISITPSVSTICSGQSQTLSSSGLAPFVWTASSGASPASAATVTVTPASTTTYTVLSGAGTCTATAFATVTIAPPTTIAVTPSLSVICVGQSVGLSSSGPGPFAWSASTGTAPASAANVTVSPTSTTTYTVISGTGTCTSSAVATVSISLTPSISITPSLTTICLGQSIGLSSSGSAPFVWAASTGTAPASAANVTVTPSSTTTYTVLSGAGTCTAQAVATVSIGATPSISITPSNTTICLGASVNLSSTGAGPFTWTASTGTSPSSAANVTVTPSATTTYTVLSGTGACTTTAVATVSIAPTLTINITPSSSVICSGSSASLSSSGAGPFTWTASTGTNPASSASITVTPTINTTYTVLSGTGACTAQAVASVSIAPTLSITAVPSTTTICNGMTATLIASGASTYTWSPGLITNDTITVSPTTTTSYSVIGQSALGCVEVPAVATVSVVPAVNPILSIASTTVCLTNTTTVFAPVVSGYTYTWQPTSAISGPSNTSSIVALPTSSATVIYSVTISNGVCADKDTIQLKVKTKVDITNITTLNNDTICVGGCVTFSAATTGSQPVFYQWYYQSGVGTSSVGIAPEACYPAAGSFSVVATASNTCGVDTMIKTNFIDVFNMPLLVVHGDTTIKIGEAGEIFASGGLSYLWSPNVNGNTIACVTCSNTVVQPTLTTQYIVVASNSPYCKMQDTVTVIVDVNCGDFFIPNVFSPNDDGLNDVINIHGRCITTFNLQIFNRWGEKVFETSSLENSWDGKFRGQKLDTGVFVYKADGVSIDGQSFKMQGNITLIR